MHKYYIYTDNVVRGPYEQENIALMYSEGRISSETPVSTGRGTPWQSIADRQEIIDAAEKLKNNVPAGAPSTEEKFIFYCPKCNQKYSGHSSWQGRDIVCVHCSEVFIAGGAAASLQPEHMDADCSITDWSSGSGNLICPHCWYHFNREDILYIATHPSLMGDPILGHSAMKRFVPIKFNAQGQALDEMNQITNATACPRCRLKVPLTILDEQTCYFSIVGAPSSGKSYYLATLLHTLRGRTAAEIGYTLLDIDPDLNRVLDSYEEALFHAPNRDSVAILPKTQQTGIDFVNVVELDNVPIHFPKPFIYELKQLPGHSRGSDCNIIFYDNAGEQFQPGADNISNPGTRHLACSNGIIFIFDPVNDALMRDLCDPEDPQLHTKDFIYDQTRLLSEMIARIRSLRSLTSGEKCDIPLVIAVGKYDVWKKYFPNDLAQLDLRKRDSREMFAVWDRNMMLEVSIAVREILMRYVPGLVAAAEAFFDKVSFIPFSSFGCLSSSSESGQLGVIPDKLHPVWAAEPFMALLAENDLITLASASADAIPLHGKSSPEGVIFNHPLTNTPTHLPVNYAGAVIKFGSCYYKLPTMENSNSIWD